MQPGSLPQDQQNGADFSSFTLEDTSTVPFIKLKKMLVKAGLPKNDADACPDKAHLLVLAERCGVCAAGTKAKLDMHQEQLPAIVVDPTVVDNNIPASNQVPLRSMR